MTTLIINEFLCFLTAQFDKIDRENLISTLGDFYSYREALEAKNLLVTECEKASLGDSIKDFSGKRVEGKAGALRRVITDIVNIWTSVDRENAGNIGVDFVAANPNRLPNVNAEKFSLQFLIAEIKKLNEKVEKQSDEILAVKTLCQSTVDDRQNKPNNKRKLSGSSEPFTPKALRRDSFVSAFSSHPAPSPTPLGSGAAAATTSVSPSASSSASSSSTAATASKSPSTSLAASPTAPPTGLSAAAPPAAPPAASAAASPAAPPSASLDHDGNVISVASLEAEIQSEATDASSKTSSTVKSKSTFADKAKALQKSNGNWIDVTRKRKNITPVVGTAETTTLEGVPVAKRDFWDIAVSRLKAETTVDNVKAHLASKDIQCKEVFVFPSKIKGTVAAKVRVALDHKDLALASGTWPTGVRVSSWLNKSKSERKNDLARKNAERQNES